MAFTKSLNARNHWGEMVERMALSQQDSGSGGLRRQLRTGRADLPYPRLSGRRFYLMRTEIDTTDTRNACVRVCLREAVPGVPASLVSRFHNSPHSPSESFQHARTGGRAAWNHDFHCVALLGIHMVECHPCALSQYPPSCTPSLHRRYPRFPATMGALTPARPALHTR